MSDRSLSAASGALPLVARIYARVAFPVVIVGGLWGATALQRATGIDPSAAGGAAIFVGYVFLALSERLLPWHQSWLSSRGDLRTDIGLFFTNAIVSSAVGAALLAGAAFLAARLSEAVGTGVWPGAWPLPAQLALALVVAELVEYSFHRAMHEVPWLWRFHATHHSAPRLYFLNAVRFHPVDLILVGSVKLVPLALLGAGPLLIALVNVFSGLHGAFQHANVPVKLGPLNWIFSMSELHRWHHSKNVEEANHNYGGNLILWDIVFGTRYLPADREPSAEIGIGDLPHFPMGYWANLAAPFRWQRTQAAARRAS